MMNYNISITDDTKAQHLLALLNDLSYVKVSKSEEDERSVDERLLAAIKKRKPNRIAVEVNENGHIVVDKDLHPRLYDWAVNG